MSWHTSGTGGCPGLASSSPASSWPARASLWGRAWREPCREARLLSSGTLSCGTSVVPTGGQERVALSGTCAERGTKALPVLSLGVGSRPHLGWILWTGAPHPLFSCVCVSGVAESAPPACLTGAPSAPARCSAGMGRCCGRGTE